MDLDQSVNVMNSGDEQYSFSFKSDYKNSNSTLKLKDDERIATAYYSKNSVMKITIEFDKGLIASEKVEYKVYEMDEITEKYFITESSEETTFNYDRYGILESTTVDEYLNDELINDGGI